MLAEIVPVWDIFLAEQRTGKEQVLTDISTDKSARIQCILAKKPLEFLCRSARIRVTILVNVDEREDADASSVFSGMGNF